jgi:hypothetical protein
MARKVNRLTAQFVKTIKVPGRYADGGNLYLLVGEGGAKSWIFLFRWQVGNANSDSAAPVTWRLPAPGSSPLPVGQSWRKVSSQRGSGARQKAVHSPKWPAQQHKRPSVGNIAQGTRRPTW